MRTSHQPTVEVEVEEEAVPFGEGFHVAVLGDHEADVAQLIARATTAAGERVGRQYLEPADNRG